MAFNLFPQTDFRQMDLGWILCLLKKIAEQSVDPTELNELKERVDGLEDNYANMQTIINELIATRIFTTPEEHGAVGDGETDDTAAIQAAIEDVKPVFMGGTYAITDTIHINKDKLVLCGENCLLITTAPMTYAIMVGDEPTTGPDAALGGLVQVFWYGGTLKPQNSTNVFIYGFTFRGSFESYFYGVSVTDCYGTGFRWDGNYGASTIVDHCAVRGPGAGPYGNYGYQVARYDQLVTNCSCIDMKTGFYADRGHVKIDHCACWLTRIAPRIEEVVGYDIISTMCSVQDCSIDTLPTGIKLYNTTANFYAQGLTWLRNIDVIPDEEPINYVLFKGAEAGTTVHGFVSGVQSFPWQKDVHILEDVSGLEIIGFTCRDTSRILDFDTAVTQFLPNYHGADEKFLSGAGGVYVWKNVDSPISVYTLSAARTNTDVVNNLVTYTYGITLTQTEIENLFNNIKNDFDSNKIVFIKFTDLSTGNTYYLPLAEINIYSGRQFRSYFVKAALQQNRVATFDDYIFNITKTDNQSATLTLSANTATIS